MTTTFIRLELRRKFRDYISVFFIAILPAFFYLIFGASQSYASESAGHGNVAMYIMISMVRTAPSPRPPASAEWLRSSACRGGGGNSV